MKKEHIIAEIQRTAKANGGVAPGRKRFESETGIGKYEWFGKFWARWSDAVREAGLQPNSSDSFRGATTYSDDDLLETLALLTRRLGRVPAHSDVLLATKNEPGSPSTKAFRRLGSKARWAEQVITYCESRGGYQDVADLWRQLSNSRLDEPTNPDAPAAEVGYVYLLKHGSRREYKIGRTYNPLRREGEVGLQLPEKLKPIHYIQTDDPAGVETYWHTRFASKRKEGEWFALSHDDVRAFKRWKRIY
jgi:hypothetical protein